MRIRYDSPSEGIDVAGDRQDLLQLAELVASGRGKLDTATGHWGDSGVVYLDGVVVEDGEGHASITVDDRRCLTIRGGQDARAALAQSLRDIADMDAGGHSHCEYFDGHFFLAPDSMPMVVNSPHGGMRS